MVSKTLRKGVNIYPPFDDGNHFDIPVERRVDRIYIAAMMFTELNHQLMHSFMSCFHDVAAAQNRLLITEGIEHLYSCKLLL